MLKWKLLLTTLPVVVLVVVAKLVLGNVFGMPGWVDIADVSVVLTAGAFLIGFMLAGTMADYKESERLPSELAVSMESIDDLIAVASPAHTFDAAAARRALLALGEAVLGWFARRVPGADVWAAMDAMRPHLRAIDTTGAVPHSNRAVVFLHAVRRIFGRIEVVSRTRFIASGYAIAEVIVVAVVLLLLVARYKTPVDEYTLIVSITLIYTYMLRLIHDIDDPFEYGPDLARRGASEVELFPLTDFVARLRVRVNAGG